jgi:hypothetical protein
LNITQTNTVIIKNSKIYKTSNEILDQRFFFNFVKFLIISKRSIQKFYQFKIEYFDLFKSILKIFFLNQNQLINIKPALELQNKFKIQNNIKRPFLFLSPKIITEFAKIQMAQTQHIKLNKNNFATNLQTKLLNFIAYFLTEFKYDIIGLKIICTGK